MEEQAIADAVVRTYDDHIVEVEHLDDWEGKDNLEAAIALLEVMKKFTAGPTLKGLLIVAPSLHKSKEILDYYQKTDVNDLVRALVIKSFAAKIVGNMYLKLSKGKANENGRVVPTKLFTDKAKAVDWLNAKIAAYQSQGSAS